jgi:hypothetical protein
VEIDDPYAAMAELTCRPTAYSSLVLSLATLFREELQIIAVAKRRYPDIEIWLTRPDGRNAALDEAMRLGADGYLAEDGLHRLAAPAPVTAPCPDPAPANPPPDVDRPLTDPVLSAEELRALLDDPPLPPA